AHAPAREAALLDVLIGKQRHVAVPRVAHDAAVQRIDLGARPFEDLQEQLLPLLRDEHAGDAMARVARRRVADILDQRVVDRFGGAARIEEADEHVTSPYPTSVPETRGADSSCAGTHPA